MRYPSLAISTLGAVGLGLAVSGSAASDSYTQIYDSCKNELKLTDSACECVVSESKKQLNKKELAFFLAAISGDGQKMAEAQAAASGDEILNVTNFMTVTPTQCQNQ